MSKNVDLTGQKFGKLLVIERTENPNNKKKCKYWKCICDCGKESIQPTTNLLSGKSTECWDCSHITTGLKRRRSLVGQKFGHLTVIEEQYGVMRGNRQRTICICRCDCGNVIKRSKESLSKDKICHCGCGRKETASKLAKDIIGQRFGRLTVIDELTDISPRRVVCKCDCGKITTIVKTDVMAGHTQSCGCLHSEATTKANLKDWTGYVSPFGVKALTQEEKNVHGVWLWKYECPFCGNNFVALPATVASGKIKSCGCIAQSSGEVLIAKTLSDYGVEAISQYRFKDCKDIRSLPFDFALIKNDKVYALIEYDGRQHDSPVDFFGGEEAFTIRKEHDEIKDRYCKDNNIPLYRFNYLQTLDEIKEGIINIINP